MPRAATGVIKFDKTEEDSGLELAFGMYDFPNVAAGPRRPWFRRPGFSRFLGPRDGSRPDSTYSVVKSKQTGATSTARFRGPIFLLIGIVSVTAALITWRAVTLSEDAGDEDNRSIFGTVQRQNARANIESLMRQDRQYYSRYRAWIAEAEGLEKLATVSRSGGGNEEARTFEEEAKQLRGVADSLKITKYVSTSDGEMNFDENSNRRDRTSKFSETAIDPGKAAAQAAHLRQRSLRLIGLVAALTAVIVVLMVAQLSPVTIRPYVGGAGALLYVAITLAAFLGDKG